MPERKLEDVSRCDPVRIARDTYVAEKDEQARRESKPGSDMELMATKVLPQVADLH